MSDHGRRIDQLTKGPSMFLPELKHERAPWLNASSICDNGMNDQGIEYRIDHGKQGLTSRSCITDSDFDRQEGQKGKTKAASNLVHHRSRSSRNMLKDVFLTR
jgi:hypothetical protein